MTAGTPPPMMPHHRHDLPSPPVAAGVLVNRPDLSDAVVRRCIAERLAFEGRNGPDPEVVLLAARLGKRKALAFLRKLVLPPPVGTLEMPERPILRAHYDVTHAH